MGTSVEFVEFVLEQIEGVGVTRYRKMFGEYMVYVNEKPVLLVCDDTVFVKKVECIDSMMRDSGALSGYPYDGAKEHWILDIDNAQFSIDTIKTLEPCTPLPKKRKKKA